MGTILILKRLKHGLLLAKIAWKIFYSKITGRRVPVIVSLHLTNKCNLRCHYCYSNIDTRFDKPPVDFTTAEVKKIIDEVYEAGCRWVILLGGEPMLRQDLGYIIKYIKYKGMLCELVTNGTLIERKIDQIENVDLLCISLDGDERANDPVRGEGTYKKIVHGLEVATRAGIKTRLHATLTKLNNNIRSIKHLAFLSEKYGTTFGFSSPITHDYNAIAELDVSPEDVVAFWKVLKKFKETSGRNYYTNRSLDYVINWPLKPLEIVEDPGDVSKLHLKRCHVGSRYCYIDSEGFVYPCIVRGIKNGLNVKEVGFQVAWQHLSKFTCGACAYIQYVEVNDILNLSFHSFQIGLNVFFR
ncbi:MAG: radical SAM/SPASM domain-containing protein [Promethearchaeota archaeon]